MAGERREVAPRAGENGRVDRHVAARVRQRRVFLGLTQHQLAELVGVTYQQAHKYETGVSRISAGRLHQIALALGLEVGHFFEGLDGRGPEPPGPVQRMLVQLARDFAAIPHRGHREALSALARAMAACGPPGGEDGR